MYAPFSADTMTGVFELVCCFSALMGAMLSYACTLRF